MLRTINHKGVEEKVPEALARDEQLTKALENPRATLRALVKESLYMFIQYFWDEYSTEEFQGNWHLEKVICPELEKLAHQVARGEQKEYDLIINVPPGTSKTATVSIMFPIWVWVNYHTMRFIGASYTGGLSLENADYSREVIRSKKFRDLFPEIDIKEDKDTKSNFRIVKKEWIHHGQVPRLKKGGNRFSTSVGATFTGFHAHFLIIDDPLDPMGALSNAKIKEATHWFDNVLPFRKIDKDVTITILIMQRVHQNDPTGHLLRERPEDIKQISLPGEIKHFKDRVQPPELVEYYSKDGLLDPVRLTWDALDKLHKLGQYTYSGQVGQNPIPLGGGMFETDSIAILEYPPNKNEIVAEVRFWDKAGTQGGDGARTAGVKMVRLKNGKFVVMNVKKGRWSSNVRENIIKLTAQADGLRTKIGIEQEPGSGGKESAENTIKNLAGFNVYKERPTGDKALRADPYSVQVNEGNVMVLKGDWNAEYIDELANFPNGTYKDQVDASSGAFAKVSGLRQVTVG